MIVLLGCGSDSGPAPVSTPTPINNATIVSRGTNSVHQQETTLTHAPGGRVVATWIGALASGLTQIEYAISDDDGATWGKAVALPMPTTVRAVADESVAVDSAGNVVLVALGAFFPHMEVLLYRLPVGATTFAAPVAIETLDSDGSRNLDKTQVVRTSSGWLVTYVMTIADFIGVALTSPDGVTWRRDTIATNHPTMLAPCADGVTVSAVYIQAPANSLWLASSADGGVTWAPPIKLADGASLSSVPACVRHGADTWVLYGTGNSGVHLLRVTAGVSQVAILPDRGPGATWLGTIALRSDDNLNVGFYQSSDDVPTGFTHQVIAPNGTLVTGDLVRNQLQLSSGRFALNDWHDYVAVDGRGGVFIDNSSDTSHVAFFKIR